MSGRSFLALGALLASSLTTVVLAPGAHAADALLSQGRPATASSQEGAGYTPAAAVDGDLTGTRWASQWSDQQWLQVDLGRSANLSRVVLTWEAAYGKDYEIQASDNGTDWRTLRKVTGGDGGTDDLAVAGSGRYVRMQGLARATGYGYSLWEFQVYGSAGGTQAPGAVKVEGSQGDWRLTVGGQPYTVKGVTWGPAIADAPTYLPDVRAMGANTIRTWGTDGSSKALLDAAAANGIRVINGFWLQPGGGPGSGGCVNYVTDTTYKNDSLSQFAQWVEAYKSHPATLMWNVGNESVLGLQNCYSGSELEAQRNAYTGFVNDVARKIHSIDPDHPVTSTDAWTGAWPYYRRNAPDLDLYAVNAYNGVCKVRQDWTDGGYTKPYVITETGPAGEWEVPNDVNGVPDEPTDVQKADAYTKAWNCVTGHQGVALGATLFHYGTEHDFGGVWFNLVPDRMKRLSYYAVKRAYTGSTAGDNTPPVISTMSVSPASSAPAGGEFTVRADVRDPDGDPVTYKVFLSGNYASGDKRLVEAQWRATGSGTFAVTAPQKLGVWKVYLQAEDGHGNAGIETRSVKVVAPPVSGTNLALNRPATASSSQASYGDCPCTPQLAVDGRADTRWASDWSDPQWFQVDLGAAKALRTLQLVWDPAYAKSYAVQVSDDGTTWRSVYSTAAGDGDVDTVPLPATARYVRLQLTARGTGWGYSLHELGIYG
ncbi:MULTISPECIES: discoidin domain-containing protein [Streptomyces]|uniref:Coagulation factor 5/8 type domain protein n=2 Tax=Streptomyces TaxID=1883 RepID=A0A2U9NVA0_STRAS|nr:discoidin domain-containing protein [Streptomyces actuosus]AWT41209.1 coagulation factor 5/8 type domain protein [Streptomyces actuosus]MBM4826264.1 discoidin domain-containing protein [Streptomyces actuosus]